MSHSHYLKKSETKPARSGGIGCLTVLGIIFVVLKLLSVPPVATWSWWMVLSPFIVQAVLLCVVFAFLGAVFLLAMKKR